MADATIVASIAAGMAQAITYLGGSVTFNGNAYTVGRNTSDTEKQTDALGEVEVYRETLTFLNSDLTANGDTIAIDDVITTPEGDRQVVRIRADEACGTITRVTVGELY